MDFRLKMLIKSQNTIGTEIASELSGSFYAVTRREISAEMLEQNNAVLIDNTTGDMDQALETLLLSGDFGTKTFVLTNDTAPLISTRNSVLFISATLGTKNICRLIYHYLDVGNCRTQTEKAISRMLLSLGFQPHLKGYRYSMEAISVILTNPEFSYSFNNRIYPLMAENHDVTPASVERAIRNSITLAYDRNRRKFDDLFGYPIQKPVNTEFLSFCAEKIRIELF